MTISNSDWDGDVSLCRPSNSWQVRDQYVKRSHSLLSPFCHSCHLFVIVFTSLSLLSPVHHCFHQFVIAEIDMMESSTSMLSPYCHYRRRDGFKNSSHRNQPLTDDHRLVAKKGTCWCQKRLKQCFGARNAFP